MTIPENPTGFIPISAITEPFVVRGHQRFQDGPVCHSPEIIMAKILKLDSRESLFEFVPIPRSSSWRVRREDFGGLAFRPKDAKLIRLDGDCAVGQFLAQNSVNQLIEGESIKNSLRAPVKLFLDITKICNETCQHCLSNSGNSRETLPLESVKSILQQSYELGVFQVKIGGGEPLFHPRFFEIVNTANDLGMAVSISTNGTTITQERARLLRATETKVSVSIDGDASMHDRVRGFGSYQKALQGIEMLLFTGVRPTLRMTLFNHPEFNNLSVVKSVVELGAQLELPVKLRRAKPSGRAYHNDLSLVFPTSDYWELLEWLEVVRAQGNEVDIEDLMCLTGDGSDKIFPTEFDCAAGTRSIHVDVYGNVSPCVFLGPFYVSGNIFIESFKEIWLRGNGFDEIRKYTAMPNKDCHSCERNKLCSGECRAVAFRALAILGQQINGGSKDPCCPKERKIYQFKSIPDEIRQYLPVFVNKT